MEQITINPQLPNFISLVKESLQIYKLKFNVLLLLSLISYGLTFFTAATIAAITMPAVLVGGFFPSKVLLWIFWGILFIIAMLLIMAASLWLQAGTLIIVKDRAEKIGLGAALRQANHCVIPLTLTILILLPILFLGWTFFAIPGIIFSIWFLFTSYIVITENKKGIDAIAKSREYVRGYFGKILILELIAGFAMVFIMAIFESISKNLPSGNLIYFAISVLMAPLSLIYTYLIFEHLKKIKGDTVVMPTEKQKNVYKVFAGIGLTMMIATIGLLIYYAPQIKNYYDTEVKNYETQTGKPLIPITQNPI